MISNKVDVVKLDHLGHEVFRYPGRVLALNDAFVRLEAFFTFGAVEVEEIVLKKGDRFMETFYFDRWYNIFEIHAGSDDRLKAYYCNIGYPAVLMDGEVSYRDLALDLLVRPDGRETVLDMDEFEALPLDDATREQALSGLEAVRDEVRSKILRAR